MGGRKWAKWLIICNTPTTKSHPAVISTVGKKKVSVRDDITISNINLAILIFTRLYSTTERKFELWQFKVDRLQKLL